MEDAFPIDKKTEIPAGPTTFYNKEMSKVCVAFKILANGEKAPAGYDEQIGCPLIFDVKLENFQFKARMVGNSKKPELQLA